LILTIQFSMRVYVPLLEHTHDSIVQERTGGIEERKQESDFRELESIADGRGGISEAAPQLEVENLGNNDLGIDSDWHYERIRDLSAPLETKGRQNDEESGLSLRVHEKDPRRDIQTGLGEEIKSQLDAYGCDNFDVSLKKGSKIKTYEMSKQEILDKSSWFLRMNGLGYDHYIRPEGNNMVLVVGLDRKAIERMKLDGYSPCVVVEEKKGFVKVNNTVQAWVKLDDKAVSKEVREKAVKAFAERYGGSPKVREDHFGRIAGYIRNEKHLSVKKELRPIVVLREGVDRIAEKGRELVNNIKAYINNKVADVRLNKRLDAILKHKPKDSRSISDSYKTLAQVRLENKPSLGELRTMDMSVDKKKIDLQFGSSNVKVFPDISMETIREEKIKGFMKGLEKMDIGIAKDLKEMGFGDRGIMETLKSLSPNFATKAVTKGLTIGLEKALSIGMDNDMDKGIVKGIARGISR